MGPLPMGLLVPLSQLKSLNLSGNHLVNFSLAVLDPIGGLDVSTNTTNISPEPWPAILWAGWACVFYCVSAIMLAFRFVFQFWAYPRHVALWLPNTECWHILFSIQLIHSAAASATANPAIVLGWRTQVNILKWMSSFHGSHIAWIICCGVAQSDVFQLSVYNVLKFTRTANKSIRFIIHLDESSTGRGILPQRAISPFPFRLTSVPTEKRKIWRRTFPINNERFQKKHSTTMAIIRSDISIFWRNPFPPAPSLQTTTDMKHSLFSYWIYHEINWMASMTRWLQNCKKSKMSNWKTTHSYVINVTWDRS